MKKTLRDYIREEDDGSSEGKVAERIMNRLLNERPDLVRELVIVSVAREIRRTRPHL